MQKISVVAVGDSNVGKSSFLITWSSNAFPEDFVPTIFESCCTNIIIGEKPFSVSFCDTSELLLF